MYIKFVFSAILCVIAFLETTLATKRTTYKAAVYAHAPILPPYTTVSIGRKKALEYMQKNLDIYKLQAIEARKQDADILILPEDGLYGTNFTRQTIYPYLEHILNPKTVTSIPCDAQDNITDTEVQRALSCMARENFLYLVADMGDKQPCVPFLEKECPEDGRFQYNTAVAYGPDGRLVAKYHKYNLYYEHQFDIPVPEAKYFDTPFGRFGLLICFDLLFRSPLFPLLFQQKVDNIAFPTAWMDALPLLSAIGYHSSMARGFHVNLLSSNLHIPESRFQGSGIYTPEGMASFYYNNTPGSDPRLLVAEVKVIKSSFRSKRTNDLTSHYAQQVRRKIFMKNGISKQKSNHFELIFTREDGRKIKNTNTRQYTPKRFINHLNIHTQRARRLASLLGYGPPTFDNQNYAFVPLTENSSTAHVCRNEICCDLEYTLSRDPQRPELFVLGAFDGIFHSKYYFQVCTVLKCPTLEETSCGSFTIDSWTNFTALTLTGSITSDYVLPQLVLSRDGQLKLAEANQWMYRNKTLTVTQGLDTPLLSATILGRVYDRDPTLNIH